MVEVTVAVPVTTSIVVPKAGSVSVPPATVAVPWKVTALTSTEPLIRMVEPAAMTTLLPSIQGVGVPSASSHMPVVQAPLPDQ